MLPVAAEEVAMEVAPPRRRLAAANARRQRRRQQPYARQQRPVQDVNVALQQPASPPQQLVENIAVEELYAGPNLENYRLEKIRLDINSIHSCPPQDFVERQLRELERDLEEDWEATSEHIAPYPQCSYCLTNKATRMAVPCGHWAGCIECCSRGLRIPIYFEAVGGLVL
ncbi:uncharacterized protein LOC120353563 [Nilaparvata lugens]|uniref:uncharacterized protein LOC120353563 n=1 Tax=Nilaparvata lugens TaxID=108931 RepID=UPI00193CD7F8|nr:uncharacterized protein LOC120353563 [Nilaparvata lugens]